MLLKRRQLLDSHLLDSKNLGTELQLNLLEPPCQLDLRAEEVGLELVDALEKTSEVL